MCNNKSSRATSWMDALAVNAASGSIRLCLMRLPAGPTWRRVQSDGPVYWAFWRSCGGGSAPRMRSWPSRCPWVETSPLCCSSRTTARCVLQVSLSYLKLSLWISIIGSLALILIFFFLIKVHIKDFFPQNISCGVRKSLINSFH